MMFGSAFGILAPLIAFVIWLAVILYLFSLATRLVVAVERIAAVLTSGPVTRVLPPE